MEKREEGPQWKERQGDVGRYVEPKGKPAVVLMLRYLAIVMKEKKELKEENIDGEKNQERISGGSTSIIYHRLRAFECSGVSSSATGVLMVPSHRHAPSSSPVDLRRV